MALQKVPPLILFSGLAADANVFSPQKIAFPQLIVPVWPIPLQNESLDAYCDRLADNLRPLGEVILGGASFGGIIALHVAQRIQPLAVLLIGSVRSPGELAGMVQICRPIKPLVPWIPVRLFQLCCAPITSKLGRRLLPYFSALTRQFRDADPRVLKWSFARLLDWNCTPSVECPVFQIHGNRDFIMPIRYTKPDVIVDGGGHVISLTHSAAVNNFISAKISDLLG